MMEPFKIEEKILSWISPEEIEPQALQQLKNIAALPFVDPWISVMPDVHLGKGATVGSVIPTKNVIIPAAVGVDVCCGMLAWPLKVDKYFLMTNAEQIREAIQSRVPTGKGMYQEPSLTKQNSLANAYFTNSIENLKHVKRGIAVDLFIANDSWEKQLGTLGSGNHFLEISLDQDDCPWVVVHSGSRGIGNKIAKFYMDEAKQLMEDFHIDLPDKDLAYIPRNHKLFYEYIKDMNWLSGFAYANRDFMLTCVLEEFQKIGVLKDFTFSLPFDLGEDFIHCRHNFVQEEMTLVGSRYVTRKGAIGAKPGERGIIPGSMGAKSYLVTGAGNRLSFDSAPHGAGRAMSRTAAKKKFSMVDMEAQMGEGISYRKSESLLDELPEAYKNIDRVMENASSLVRVTHELRQIINIKGD